MPIEIVDPTTLMLCSGVEGATEDGAVAALRGRQMRNFMVALLVSQGTPMVLAGALRRRTVALLTLRAIQCIVRVSHPCCHGPAEASNSDEVREAPSACRPDVPFACAGDEYAATRGGNNNWYGHDNEMTWFDWDTLEEQRDGYFRFYRWTKLLTIAVTGLGSSKHGGRLHTWQMTYFDRSEGQAIASLQQTATSQ
jgi:hypothetical protein